MKEVNFTIQAICEYIQETLKSNPTTEECECISNLIDALARLINSTL